MYRGDITNGCLSGEMLKCGVHTCTSSCHQLFDHSKILCQVVLTRKCENGHIVKWKCHATPPLTCSTCERARKEALKKAQKDLEDQRRRDENKLKHLNEVAKLEEEMEKISRSRSDKRIVEEQQNVLAQKRKDLATAKRLASQPQVPSQEENSDDIYSDDDNPVTKTNPQFGAQKSKNQDQTSASIPTSTPPPKKTTKPQGKKQSSSTALQSHLTSAVDHNSSKSRTEWQRQKDQENAHNPAIDKIMEMVGLEDVKDKVLKIKAKVDTSKRQGTDLTKERLGLVLLGNPGTGKQWLHTIKRAC